MSIILPVGSLRHVSWGIQTDVSHCEGILKDLMGRLDMKCALNMIIPNDMIDRMYRVFFQERATFLIPTAFVFTILGLRETWRI